MYLLEEAYEVLEAVEKASPQDVCAELGDLLFQILFLTRLAEERNEFDVVDVIERITEKMIRRHPHVFGETTANSADEVTAKWAEIKQAEKGNIPEALSLLKDIPADLPSLLKSHRLIERSSRLGFDWAHGPTAWKQVSQRFRELEEAVTNGDENAVGQGLGELLFSLANLGRRYKLNAESLLRAANQAFLERLERMERELSASGVTLENASDEQKKRAWQKANE
jgi:MazG family protein